MGIYSEGVFGYNEELGIDMDALNEAFFIDDMTHNYGPDTIKEVCAPNGVGEALVEAGVLSSKRSIVRLAKTDDLKRRTLIAAIQMAKDHNDPLVQKLIKQRIAWKQTRAKIYQKYSAKANKAAIIGQKNYIKSMRGVSISNNLNSAAITKDSNR